MLLIENMNLVCLCCFCSFLLEVGSRIHSQSASKYGIFCCC